MPAPSKKIDIESRVYQIQKWLLDGLSFKEIETKAAKWKVSVRTLERYVARAKDNWVKEERESIDIKRAQKVKELEALKKSLIKKYRGHPAGIMAVARVENQLIKLQGLAAPLKVEHTGANGSPIQVDSKVSQDIDYDKLSPETLREILSARVKREE
jgi:ribosomal protein L17